jgi:DNA replication licensing factor MCM7
MEAQVRGNQPGTARPAANTIPPILNRRFEVWFKPSSAVKAVPIREIKANCIGKLISLKVLINDVEHLFKNFT